LSIVHYDAIVGNLRRISTLRLLTALAATGLNYFVLTGYDWLAFRYIHRPLEYSKIALASFIGYSFSNSVGLSMLAGSTVRYRLYSAWGLSALEITKVVAFYTLTLLLGLCGVAGGIFLLRPVNLPSWLHLPFASTRPLGCLLLLLLGAYVLSGVLRQKPLRFWFKGLRHYKEKFDPQWEPKYIACPSGFLLPRILSNIAALTSGGVKGVIAK
jgi:uncharacterized membrane protein YbhN (UPF0104 family)